MPADPMHPADPAGPGRTALPQARAMLTGWVLSERARRWHITIATSPEMAGDIEGAHVADAADTRRCGQCGAPVSPLRYAQAGRLCARCEATPGD